MKKLFLTIALLLILPVITHATIVCDPGMKVFGDGRHGAFSSTQAITWVTPTTPQGAIVKQYTDFTLNAGHVFTTGATQTRGMHVYASSSITLNSGEITMTGLAYVDEDAVDGYVFISRSPVAVITTITQSTFTSTTLTSYLRLIKGGDGGRGGHGGTSVGVNDRGDGKFGESGGIAGGGVGGGGGEGEAATEDGNDGHVGYGNTPGWGGTGTSGGDGGYGGSNPGGTILLAAPQITVNGVTYYSYGLYGGGHGGWSADADCGGGGGGSGGGAVIYMYLNYTEISAPTYVINGSSGGGMYSGAQCTAAGPAVVGWPGGAGHVYKVDLRNETFTVVQ